MAHDSGVELKGARFLITGGSGFVGTHLVHHLLAEGADEVRIYDKAPSPVSDARVRSIPGDILDGAQLREAMRGVDGVFHLAVLPLGPCDKDRALAFQVNVRGTFEVASAGSDSGVRKLVYASASSVYGDTRELMDEEHPFNPWSMYGVSKLCGEFLLRPFRGTLKFAIVRYMNVYGPGQAGGLIPSVLGKIRANQPPVISGDGSASFDFVHVRDVARCTALAMSSNVTEEAFNVGSGTEVSVKEIVTLMLQLTGSPLQPVYEPNAAGAMIRRVGSAEKAKRLLGFEASVPFRQGLSDLAKGTV